MNFDKGASFQDRIARAAEAKKKALDLLRSRPAVDPELLAQRRAAQEKRDAAEAEARAARKAAQLAEKQSRIVEVAAALQASAPPPAPSEAERKAARDARYAARKSRKQG